VVKPCFQIRPLHFGQQPGIGQGEQIALIKSNLITTIFIWQGIVMNDAEPAQKIENRSAFQWHRLSEIYFILS
jgi:hypothetical protein